MKTTNFSFILLFTTCSLFFTGCGNMTTMSLNSVELTNQLRPGMSYSEVEAILGKPRGTAMLNDQWIARWNLQEMWRGYVPYDMVFNPADQTLISWGENTKAFEQKQQQLQMVADELEKQPPATVTNEGKTATVPAFENDASLMQYFSGEYYSFSAVGGGQTGGTERKVSLCENGKYISSSESGYSGNAGAWGTASQGANSGTWRITGNKNTGTIVTTDNNGKPTTYKYESCGNGCIYLGNTKFAYAGKAKCW
jgi:hypothetical protein